MRLDELINALEAADQETVASLGFTNPHSFRGYYDELAFEPARNVTVAAMLRDARSALGATYQGWKGGEYTMHGYTDCWIAVEGDGNGETIGPILLGYMVGGPVAFEKATPCPEGFHYVGQKVTSCDKCGLPARDHAGVAVPARPMTSPFDDVPMVLSPWKSDDTITTVMNTRGDQHYE